MFHTFEGLRIRDSDIYNDGILDFSVIPSVVKLLITPHNHHLRCDCFAPAVCLNDISAESTPIFFPTISCDSNIFPLALHLILPVPQNFDNHMLHFLSVRAPTFRIQTMVRLLIPSFSCYISVNRIQFAASLNYVV